MNDEYTNLQDGCLDWEDVIQDDGQEFIILPEGDYNFTVTAFDRGHFPGSAKIPACNKASLTLQVNTTEGIAITHTDLLLFRTLEWKICSFFRSIGQKQHGEQLVMDWGHVVGARGRAHFKPRTYTGKDGTEKQANDITRFYDWKPEFFADDGKLTALDSDSDELPF